METMKVLLTPFALMAIIHLGQAAPLLPMGKYLAYTNRAERNVVVLNAQGEKQFSIADATQPSLSPDAKCIAFARTEYISTEDGQKLQSDIWIADIASRKEHRLTNTRDYEENPAWSPDGKRVAFGVRRQGFYGNGYGLLGIINADGSDQHAITSNDGCSNPSWNPNGKQLCFVRFGQVCRVDIDGKNRRRLASAFAADVPQYSPDGRWIIFSDGNDDGVTTREDNQFGAILRGTDSILRISASGEDAQHPAVYLTNGKNDDDMPQYSADGKWIVFSSDRKDRASLPLLDPYDEGARYSRTLCLMQANGKNARILNVDGDAIFPSWR
jgi:Tol biopolymer transport system component